MKDRSHRPRRLDERGVTFLYDFGFPHAALAAEPEEEYFFSYKELKPFIDERGLLAPSVL